MTTCFDHEDNMKMSPKELADVLSLCWPDYMILDPQEFKSSPPHVEMDANVVDFIGDRGRGRYYIDKVKSNEHELVIRKFYGITY